MSYFRNDWGYHKSHELEDVYRTIDTIEPDENGHRHWLTNGVKGHYGHVKIKGKRYGVHRLVLERALGRQIKPGMLACHTCDWPSCVTEDHLYEGTDKDNARDRMERQPEIWDHVRTSKKKLEAERAEVMRDRIIGWLSLPV